MATRAHSTRTPLLPPPGATPPLLPRGLGRQPGPVTLALAAMHAADPERQHIRELRRRISERIEADIALLDALDGDADFEAVNEDGGDICDEPHDPEEDASEEELGHGGPVQFDGTNYIPIRFGRAGFEPGGLRIVGPDGDNYLVSRAFR